MSETIPEGYEPAEVSSAKDVVMEVFHDKLGHLAFDERDDHGVDCIELADACVEALIKAGVTIPEDIEAPSFL